MTLEARSPLGIEAWLKSRNWRASFVAALGGFLTIFLLSDLGQSLEIPLLIAPFGASCVLVFGAPASPFARARNVIGGHCVAALMGLAAFSIFGPGTAGAAAGVGLAIIGMSLTDMTHPPAGAVPIVVTLTQPDWSFLLTPIAVGAIAIVLGGKLYQRLVAGYSGLKS